MAGTLNIRDVLIGMAVGAALCAAFLNTRPVPVGDDGKWRREVAEADRREADIMGVVDSLADVIAMEREQRRQSDSIADAWERHFTRANYRDSSTVRKLQFIAGHR